MLYGLVDIFRFVSVDSPEQAVVYHDSCVNCGLVVLYLFQSVAGEQKLRHRGQYSTVFGFPLYLYTAICPSTYLIYGIQVEPDHI